MENFKRVQGNLSRASAEIKTTCVRTRGLAEISIPVPCKYETGMPPPLYCNGNGDIRFHPLTFILETAHSQSSTLPARNACAAHHTHWRNATAAKSHPIQTAFATTSGALVTSFNIKNLCILPTQGNYA
jgi:hypothetical protein